MTLSTIYATYAAGFILRFAIGGALSWCRTARKDPFNWGAWCFVFASVWPLVLLFLCIAAPCAAVYFLCRWAIAAWLLLAREN